VANDPKVPDDLRVPKAPGVPLPRTPFEIRFLDYAGKPMANMKCTLDWRAEKLPGVTDANGVVKFRVPTTGTTFGTLHTEAFAGQPPQDINVVMQLPLTGGETASGAKFRLANLGYLESTKATSDQTFGAEAVRALDRFRFAQRIVDAKTLVPTGPAAPPFDAATKARLEAVHDTLAAFVAP
jgi:hypothetical protein